MMVLGMEKEVKNELKGAKSYSYLINNRIEIDMKMIKDKFYQAKLYKWHTHMPQAFCVIKNGPA